MRQPASRLGGSQFTSVYIPACKLQRGRRRAGEGENKKRRRRQWRWWCAMFALLGEVRRALLPFFFLPFAEMSRLFLFFFFFSAPSPWEKSEMERCDFPSSSSQKRHEEVNKVRKKRRGMREMGIMGTTKEKGKGCIYLPLSASFPPFKDALPSTHDHMRITSTCLEKEERDP